jgi:hypothetical protein
LDVFNNRIKRVKIINQFGKVKMANKIKLCTAIFILILLSVAVFAQVGPENPNDPYTFDDFKADFEAHPIIAANMYMDYYMQLVKENPKMVAKTPEHAEAYKNIIAKDVKHLNQNIDAFKIYCNARGIEFTDIESNFLGFDESTGTFITSGPNGEAVTEFKLDDLKVLKSLNWGSRIDVNNLGQLIWSAKERILTIEGKTTTEAGLSVPEFTITEGKISLVHHDWDGEKENFNYNLEIVKGNKVYITNNEPYPKIKIKATQPIALPMGVLYPIKQYGQEDAVGIILDPNTFHMWHGELETKNKVKFEVESTIITNQKQNCVIQFSCIIDNPGKNLFVDPKKFNDIKITAPDGLYKSIIIRDIKSYQGSVGPPMSNPVELFIEKPSGKVHFVFDWNKKPIMAGNPTDLQTNVGHIITTQSDKKYPWLLFKGKEYSDQYNEGILNRELTNSIISSIKKGSDKELIELYFQTSGYFDKEDKDAVLEVLGGIKEQHLEDKDAAVLQSYFKDDILKWKNDEKFIIEALIVLRSNKNLQQKVIKKMPHIYLSNIANKDIDRLMWNLDPKTKKVFLSKINDFYTDKPFVGDKRNSDDSNPINDPEVLKYLLKYKFKHYFLGQDIIESWKLNNLAEKDPEFLDLLIKKTYITPETMKHFMSKEKFIENKKAMTTLKKEAKKVSKDMGIAVDVYVKELKGKDLEKALSKGISAKTSRVLRYLYKDRDDQKIILKNTNEFDGEDLTDSNMFELFKDKESRLELIKKIKSLNNMDTYKLNELLFELQNQPEILIEIAKKVDDFQMLGGNTFFEDSLSSTLRLETLRKFLLAAKGDEELQRDLFEKFNHHYDYGFNTDVVKKVYFSDSLEGEEDIALRYSIAMSADKLLEDLKKPPTEKNLKEAVALIKKQRKDVEDKEIMGPNTFLISVTHREDRFDPEKIEEFAKDAGVQQFAEKQKGSWDAKETKETKEKTIERLRYSAQMDEVMFWFNGHGSKKHISLGASAGEFESSDKLYREDAINYEEIGKALLNREMNGGDNSKVTMIFATCHSWDFSENLYDYLRENGAEKLPIIVTETNRGQLGWGTSDSEKKLLGTEDAWFLMSLKKAKEEGKVLRIKDLYEAEKIQFGKQDMAVRIPTEHGITDLGSRFDDGTAEDIKELEEKAKLEQEEKEKQEEEKKKDPIVIDVADSEEEMMETLEADKSAQT